MAKVYQQIGSVRASTRIRATRAFYHLGGQRLYISLLALREKNGSLLAFERETSREIVSQMREIESKMREISPYATWEIDEAMDRIFD